MENIQLKETRKRARDNIIPSTEEPFPQKVGKSPSATKRTVIKIKKSQSQALDIVIRVVTAMLVLFVILGLYRNYMQDHSAHRTPTPEAIETALSDFERSLHEKIVRVSGQYDSNVKLQLKELQNGIDSLRHKLEDNKYNLQLDEIAENIEFAKEILSRYESTISEHYSDLASFRNTITSLTSQLSSLKEKFDVANQDLDSIVESTKGELVDTLSQKYITKSDFNKFFDFDPSSASSCISRSDINVLLEEKFKQLQEDSARDIIASSFLESLNQNDRFAALVHSLQNEIFSEDVQSLERSIAEKIDNIFYQYVHQDIINRQDFAAASAGATIEYSPPVRSRCGTNSADILLNKSYFHDVGNRWCFQSSLEDNYIVIKLSNNIIPSAITLEFIENKLDNPKIAPKNFIVYGKNAIGKAKRDYEQLGQFEYRLGDKFYQTFDFTTNTDKDTSHIKIKFLSNHGDADCTCLYRVRVHGHLVE